MSLEGELEASSVAFFSPTPMPTKKQAYKAKSGFVRLEETAVPLLGNLTVTIDRQVVHKAILFKIITYLTSNKHLYMKMHKCQLD